MQKESNTYAPQELKSTTSESTTAAAHMLTLYDASIRKWTADITGQQYSTAKNYMWVSSLILAACVAFFEKADMTKFFMGTTVYGAQLFGFILLAFASGLAIVSFYKAISVLHVVETVDYATNLGTPFIARDGAALTSDEIYMHYVGLLSCADRVLAETMDEKEAAGLTLRSIGTYTKLSIACGLLSLLFYGGSML